MKKIIVAFCAILSIMVYIASPLFVKPVMAANDDYTGLTNTPEDILEDLWSTNTLPTGKSDSHTYVLQYLKSSNYTITNNDYFLYYVGFYNDNYYYTVAIDFQSADCTFENNILTLNNVTGGSTNSKGIVYLTDWYKNSGSSSSTKIDQFDRCILNFNTLSLKFYDGNTYSILDLDRYECSDIWNIKSNIPDTLTSNNLNVIVHFNPELQGHVSRPSITDNGASRLSEVFSMSVQNNSRFGIQFRMDINEYDGSVSELNYFEPNWSNGFSARGSYGFVFVNDEWIYVQPELTGGIIKTLKSSEWHYVGQGETFSQNFSWSQFNLKPNTGYVVRVIAVKNDVGCATALNASRGDFGENYPDYCIDYSEAQFVYNNVFDVVNPATYNPNDTSFGNKILHNNFDSTDKNKVSAYEDTATGNVVISNADTSKDFRDILGAPTNGGSHGGGGYYTNSSNSYNNNYVSGNTFNNLNSYFTNFFGFCNAAFAAFPAVFLTIITAGLAGLVVLGIVKAAIK